MAPILPLNFSTNHSGLNFPMHQQVLSISALDAQLRTPTASISEILKFPFLQLTWMEITVLRAPLREVYTAAAPGNSRNASKHAYLFLPPSLTNYRLRHVQVRLSQSSPVAAAKVTRNQDIERNHEETFMKCPHHCNVKFGSCARTQVSGVFLEASSPPFTQVI